MAGFENDLQAGIAREGTLVEYLRPKYPRIEHAQGCQPGWDIYLPETGLRIECKYDRLSSQTGNVAVEVEFKGRPSGLSSTESQLWAFFLESRVVFVDAGALRSTIAAGNFRTVMGGDGNQSKLVLLPIKQLLRIPGAYTLPYPFVGTVAA